MFYLVKIKPKILITALLIVLTIFILGTRYLYIPRRIPVRPSSAEARVKQGVTLEGRDVAGWSEAELRQLLARLSKWYNREPVDACLDPVTRGVIPELNGKAIDIEETLINVMKAQPHQAISLSWKDLRPSKTMEDYKEAPVYQGNPRKAQLAILINVAWGNEELPRLLETLAKLNTKATFFLEGKWTSKFPQEARQIAAAGHEIGNHALSHLHMANLNESSIIREIEETTRIIHETTGQKPKYFAPPYGEISPLLLKAAANLGYRTVLWTIDTVDWKKPGLEAMVNKILSKKTNGALILMHPTPHISEFLLTVIPQLERDGFHFVTLSELLSPN